MRMNLGECSLTGFIEKLADDSPAPGGGSVAALAGALSAALTVMVANLTLGREKYRQNWEAMEHVRASAYRLLERLKKLVDEDAQAYNQVAAAFKLPREDAAQKAARSRAIQAATRQAALVPMETLRTVSALAELVGQALGKGNPNCLTDAGVAGQLLRTAAKGAAYNVRINLSGIRDEHFTARLDGEVADLLANVAATADELEKLVEEDLQRKG
jgi:glutamate formiminotransferase/formiminotetrahydrofolate cyclodeaminase